MSNLLLDIDEQTKGQFPAPVQLGDQFMYQKKKCRVTKRLPHAFHYEIVGEPKPPMQGVNQITYKYWNAHIGKKIKRC